MLRTSAGRRFVLGATARRSLTYLSSPVLSQCELTIFIILRWMWKRLANRSPRRPQAAPWQPNHRGWPWHAPGLQGPVFNARSCSDDQPFSGCPGRLASPVGASLIRQAMDANPPHQARFRELTCGKEKEKEKEIKGRWVGDFWLYVRVRVCVTRVVPGCHAVCVQVSIESDEGTVLVPFVCTAGAPCRCQCFWCGLMWRAWPPWILLCWA